MNKSFSVCSVFVWQLLSPASVASRWVWTQSETFQRTSKLRKRPPTKAFSSILTSHQTFRRKQITFALLREHTKKKMSVNITNNTWSDLGWRAGWVLVRHETSGLVFGCLAGGLEVFLSSPNKTRQSFVLSRPPRVKRTLFSRRRCSSLLWPVFLCTSEAQKTKTTHSMCWTFPVFWADRTP